MSQISSIPSPFNMVAHLFVLVLLLNLAVSIRVMVIEFSPSPHPDAGVCQNIAGVRNAIASVARYIDPDRTLVVIPEYALFNDDYFNPAVSELVKEKCVAFCRYIKYFKFGRRPLESIPTFDLACDPAGARPTSVCSIGCVAREHRVFLAANMLTSIGGRLYNTELVYGLDSNPVATYHKIHPVIVEAKKMRITVGEADGLWTHPDGTNYMIIICFDILHMRAYTQASRVHNVIFSTEWESKQELHALAVQQAFSRVTLTNVFASNINKPTIFYSKTGSSIVVAGNVISHAVGIPTGVHTDSRTRYTVLTQDVRTDARPERAFVQDNVQSGDAIPIARAEGPRPGVTEIFYFNATEIPVLQQILRAGDLSCEFNIEAAGAAPPAARSSSPVRGGAGGASSALDPAAMRAGMSAREGRSLAGSARHAAGGRSFDDVVYVLRAMNGFIAGRSVRACSIIAVRASERRGDYRNWNDYSLRIQHRFNRLSIRSNVHGSNVATLPLALLSNNGVPTPIDRAMSNFTYTRADRADGETELTLAPGDFGVSILSVYGVIGAVEVDDDPENPAGDTVFTNEREQGAMARCTAGIGEAVGEALVAGVPVAGVARRYAVDEEKVAIDDALPVPPVARRFIRHPHPKIFPFDVYQTGLPKSINP